MKRAYKRSTVVDWPVDEDGYPITPDRARPFRAPMVIARRRAEVREMAAAHRELVWFRKTHQTMPSVRLLWRLASRRLIKAISFATPEFEWLKNRPAGT